MTIHAIDRNGRVLNIGDPCEVVEAAAIAVGAPRWINVEQIQKARWCCPDCGSFVGINRYRYDDTINARTRWYGLCGCALIKIQPLDETQTKQGEVVNEKQTT
jgi:hypothetical protein